MSTISPTTGQPTRPHDRTLPTADDQRIGSNSNRLLGTFTSRFVVEDNNGEPAEISHFTLTAGKHLGSATGYETANDAVKALNFLTTNNASSAAVLRQGDRYFGYQLKSTDLDNGYGQERADFESLADGGELTLRANAKDTMLKAVVDGGFVHRFRN